MKYNLNNIITNTKIDGAAKLKFYNYTVHALTNKNESVSINFLAPKYSHITEPIIDNQELGNVYFYINGTGISREQLDKLIADGLTLKVICEEFTDRRERNVYSVYGSASYNTTYCFLEKPTDNMLKDCGLEETADGLVAVLHSGKRVLLTQAKENTFNGKNYEEVLKLDYTVYND